MYHIYADSSIFLACPRLDSRFSASTLRRGTLKPEDGAEGGGGWVKNRQKRKKVTISNR